MSDFSRLANRREHLRVPVHREGELIHIGEKNGIPCAILDESYGGIQIEAAQAPLLPQQAIFRFGTQSSQLVRRCWISGNRAGYQFIEIVAVKRRLHNDDIQSLDQNDLVAMSDFVRISHSLLSLADVSTQASDVLNQVRTLLSNIPHARLQILRDGMASQKGVQLFAIAEAKPDHHQSDQVPGYQNALLLE